jgi:hypothetical protein
VSLHAFFVARAPLSWIADEVSVNTSAARAIGTAKTDATANPPAISRTMILRFMTLPPTGLSNPWPDIVPPPSQRQRNFYLQTPIAFAAPAANQQLDLADWLYHPQHPGNLDSRIIQLDYGDLMPLAPVSSGSNHRARFVTAS